MEREYKHSVKKSLTRKLVLIIILSVVVAYSIVMTIMIIAAGKQSDYTLTEIANSGKKSFEGQLESRSGQISQMI